MITCKISASYLEKSTRYSKTFFFLKFRFPPKKTCIGPYSPGGHLRPKLLPPLGFPRALVSNPIINRISIFWRPIQISNFSASWSLELGFKDVLSTVDHHACSVKKHLKLKHTEKPLENRVKMNSPEFLLPQEGNLKSLKLEKRWWQKTNFPLFFYRRTKILSGKVTNNRLGSIEKKPKTFWLY